MPSPYRLSDRTANLSAPSVSQTITSHETHHPISPVTLHLRGAHPPRRRIQWAEDVVDNEGMGKKSSKGTLYCSAKLGRLRAIANGKTT